MSELTDLEQNSTTQQGSGRYQFETLTEQYAPQVIKLFTRTFCDNEPITRHLNITHQEYEPFVKEVVRKAIDDGISMVALDKNGEVVACTLAEDMANYFEPNIDKYPKLKPVFVLLRELSRSFLENKIFTKGKIAHVWVAIVDENHRGEGLSTEIDMKCGAYCVNKGYDFAYAEFTNPISEKITKHYKVLKECNKIQYDEFLVEGSKPFKGVPGHASSYLVGIKPGIKMDAVRNCYKEIG